MALREKLGVSGGRIAAIGDSLNDADLLEIASHGWLGCSSNAQPQIKKLVLERQGIVAQQPYLAGTVG
jgi:hydroxymethylpyrimidine pyrophosphatase-like HAD family hydrolase